MNLEFTTLAQLKGAILELTCENCHGEGQLMSCEAHHFQGEYNKIMKSVDCRGCGGTGIDLRRVAR